MGVRAGSGLAWLAQAEETAPDIANCISPLSRPSVIPLVIFCFVEHRFIMCLCVLLIYNSVVAFPSLIELAPRTRDWGHRLGLEASNTLAASNRPICSRQIPNTHAFTTVPADREIWQQPLRQATNRNGDAPARSNRLGNLPRYVTTQRPGLRVHTKITRRDKTRPQEQTHGM